MRKNYRVVECYAAGTLKLHKKRLAGFLYAYNMK